MGCMLAPTLVMYSGESLTRTIISVFCIFKKRLPLFLQKEKERLPLDSPFSPHIHNFWEVSFLLTSFIFTHFHSLYFAVHPVCFTNGPLHNDSNPYWLAMPGAQLVYFLYNTTITSKHLMFLGLQHLNIYHMKRHHNSVNLNFFNNVAKN